MKKAILYIIIASIISLNLISCDKKSIENEINKDLKETTISNSKEDKKLPLQLLQKKKTLPQKKKIKIQLRKTEKHL